MSVRKWRGALPLCWKSAGDHLPKPSDETTAMSWMGSECRHAGRVSECIGHAEMALCGYNKSYCSPKLELIFPRVSDQANVTEKHSLLFFSGSPEAPALSLPPPRSTQKHLLLPHWCAGREAEWSHTHTTKVLHRLRKARVFD